MQTRNPFLDEMAKLTTGAMGLAQAAGDEARAAMRAQADRMVADMDLVRREELDVLKAEIAALRSEIAALSKPAGGSSRRKSPPQEDAG
ncbi:MAG: accessory factor UbiK family protein [Brevundimonas sp.]|jgi:BMFP domain-containing protein YqiC|uniref:accessory factor UbiK family protein n=1 Tax=Brevundimonas sp. TaxID=1871086 RepID=UPI0039195A59